MEATYKIHSKSINKFGGERKRRKKDGRNENLHEES